MKIDGNLYLTRDNVHRYAGLTTVGGGLYIGADAQLPALTSVGDYLSISADAQLPALTTVGGALSISADAPLPALTSVRGKPYPAPRSTL